MSDIDFKIEIFIGRINLLRSILDENADRQLQALYAVQQYCAKLMYPKSKCALLAPFTEANS
jgi:hypothetical protein